ncbi:MAG: hypothetical protein ACRD3R_00380 [Terriglobales bacterium]
MKEATRGRFVFLGIVEVLLVNATDSCGRKRVARMRGGAKIISKKDDWVTSCDVRMDNGNAAWAIGIWRLAFGDGR